MQWRSEAGHELQAFFDSHGMGGKAVEVAIEVLGHRRNSYGPFHIDAKWPSWTGPDEIKCKDDH